MKYKKVIILITFLSTQSAMAARTLVPAYGKGPTSDVACAEARTACSESSVMTGLPGGFVLPSPTAIPLRFGQAGMDAIGNPTVTEICILVCSRPL